MTSTAAPGPEACPTFLIIGAARSGTTFLAQQLASHPDVSFSDPKEPHFLAFPGQPLTFTGPGDAETINRVAITEPDRWHALFDRPTSARGEGSVSTLYYGSTAIETIRSHCPDVRCIAVLREPVDRAYSAWLYQVGKGYETESFEHALDLEADRIAAGWHHMWHYEAMGHYASQLTTFIDALGLDRLLVLDHRALQDDPTTTIGRCFAHLGLPAVSLTDLDFEVNRGGTPRSRAVAGALARARRVEPVRRAIKAVVPFKVRERLRAANLDQPPMSVTARDRLRAAFADEAEQLRSLLGDEAPAWTTDR